MSKKSVTSTAAVACTPSISLLAEIPEELHDSLQSYLETHPDFDQSKVFTAALSLFLLQNGTSGASEPIRGYQILRSTPAIDESLAGGVAERDQGE